MIIKTSFKHMNSTPSIQEITERKSERLKKYFDGNFSLSWTFEVQKNEHIVHAHLTGHHMDYFSESRTESIYAGIDEALHALEKQVKRHKEILRNRKHSVAA